MPQDSDNAVPPNADATAPPPPPACPICDTPDDGAPLATYTIEQAARHFCPSERDRSRHERLREAIADLWGGDPASGRGCGRCGHGFTDPMVGGDERFYAIMHEQAGYPDWRWEYDWVRRDVLGVDGGGDGGGDGAGDGAGGTILDVGAGDGKFLRSLPARWRKFALESTEQMRGRLRDAGISAFADHAAAADHVAAEGGFDVITGFQVLEHIGRPMEMLGSLRRLLRPGGRLVVSVPNGRGNLTQMRLTGCPDMPPNHVNQFSPESLSLALERSGLEPQPTRAEPPSLAMFQYRAVLKTNARASRGGTASAAATSLKSPRLRRAALAACAAGHALTLLPHYRGASEGRSLAVVGRAP